MIENPYEYSFTLGTVRVNYQFELFWTSQAHPAVDPRCLDACARHLRGA